MWQELLAPHVESGALVVIGVVQEQHMDRARLYRQWRGLDWPLFIDQLNLLDHKVVPIPMGINESGVVVYPKLGEDDLRTFLNKDFVATEQPKGALPHPLEGDALFLDGELDRAIDSYAAHADDDPRARFRLGVALRKRYESDARRPGDGQAAADAWTLALAQRPDQYIWRRRIQQYGPHLDKPYNMFGWIEQARADLRARGDEPVPLRVEPRGTELMGKGPAPAEPPADPDPDGKVPADAAGLVEIESIVTPARVRPGHRVRVRLVFRPRDSLWNNEAEPLSLFATPAAPLVVREGIFAHPNAEPAESRETRILECEVEVAKDAAAGRHALPLYALYGVCEKKGGTCRYLRRDLTVDVTVDPAAPRVQ